MENFFNIFKEGDYERLPNIVAKDGSSPAVSCLKFEPWSQILFETKYEKRQKDTTYAII